MKRVVPAGRERAALRNRRAAGRGCGLFHSQRGRRATIEEEMAALKQQMAALQTQITNIPAGPAGPAGPQGPPGPPGRDGIDGER